MVWQLDRHCYRAAIQRCVCMLLGLLLIAACSPTANATNQAISAAIQRYLDANAQVGPVTITVQVVQDPFARALIDPADGASESATVFLKREGSVWQVLTLGTAFDTETYDVLHIPPGLRI